MNSYSLAVKLVDSYIALNADIVMVGSKTFISGAANVNIDLFFSGLPRLPEEGQELLFQGIFLQMGGGLPATLINLGRLGIPVRIQTGLGKDMFSRFARDAF